ncbi:uncharacterized protein LOC102410588 isoform X2 [Bubalus bubalis]|uniref:uncharacterized protein LOC102410588 isoform X2 n=1 Tax=Bubalus bubalis TaxID=89462 RepID=UPI001D12692D|nr:uncharacterized protein LOC102410588 isoform X2 [Bubalus bubalis]
MSLCRIIHRILLISVGSEVYFTSNAGAGTRLSPVPLQAGIFLSGQTYFRNREIIKEYHCGSAGYRACTSSQVHWFCDDGWGTPSLRQDISSLNFLNWLLDHNCPGWNRIAEPADHCQGPVGQSPAVFLSGGRSCHERECLSSVTRDSVPDDSSTSVPPLVKTGSRCWWKTSLRR